MTTSSVRVDALIIGGGIQGLALLSELTDRGFSTALVTIGDLGEGQSLHSHGFMNSGYFFPRKERRDSLNNEWLPFARRHGLPTYGGDAFYVLAPPGPFLQLRQAWDAFGYPCQEVTANDIPQVLRDSELLQGGLQTHIFKIEEYAYPKRQLIRILSDGLTGRIIRARIAGFHCVATGNSVSLQSVDVKPHAGGDTVAIMPRFVISAAGVGTKRLFRDIVASASFQSAAYSTDDGKKVQEGILDQIGQITYRSVHMICVRGPKGVLPTISVVAVPYALMVIAHQNNAHDHVAGDESDYVSWYVTPGDPNAPPVEDVSDNSQTSVDREIVSRGLAIS